MNIDYTVLILLFNLSLSDYSFTVRLKKLYFTVVTRSQLVLTLEVGHIALNQVLTLDTSLREDRVDRRLIVVVRGR